MLARLERGRQAGLLIEVCELDLEGIVAKQADSPYKAGRQATWLKMKNQGYSRPEALRSDGG